MVLHCSKSNNLGHMCETDCCLVMTLHTLKQGYRRAGQRCFRLLALISCSQVRCIHLPEQMILPGSLIPSDKYILKTLTFVVGIHSCTGYVTALVKSFTWPG